MKQFAISQFLALLMALLSSACSSGQNEDDAGRDAEDRDSTSGTDSDADADADNDADADTDTDADGDGDTDADIDTDTDSDGDIDTDAAPTCNLVLDWVIPEGGDGNDGCGAVSTLPDGSAMIAGCFTERAYLGFDLISEGGADIFIAKYSQDGDLLWAKRAGGQSNDCAMDLASFSDGTVIVTGRFESIATFGKGEANETALTSEGGRDIFVAKYNSDGTLAWAKSVDGTGLEDSGDNVVTMEDGSSIVTGGFQGTATFGKGEPNETQITSGGYIAAFIANYLSDGTLSWAKGIIVEIDNDYIKISGIPNKYNESIYFSGSLGKNALFGKGEYNETNLISEGDYSTFLAKYFINGTLEWAKILVGEGANVSGMDSFQDNIMIMTGRIGGLATFGQGEVNETTLDSSNGAIYAAKYFSDGTLDWATNAGGQEGREVGGMSDGSSMVMGWNGPSDNTSFGTFLSKFGDDGRFLCYESVIDDIVGESMAVLDGGTVYLAGSYCDATFGPGPNQTHLVADCDGWDNDIFIAKWSPE